MLSACFVYQVNASCRVVLFSTIFRDMLAAFLISYMTSELNLLEK